FDYTGLPPGTNNEESWKAAIHSDDVLPSTERWRHSVRTGEILQTEFRLRRAMDGLHRWHLGRALPIRDSQGKIEKWFGTCTDIDDQKNQQQKLEEDIKARTAEVVDANARLKQEMEDREQAQAELNRQNSLMVEELTRSSNRASILNRMGKLLQSSSNMEEAVAIVVGLAPQVFPEFSGALLLMNNSHTALEAAG